MVNHGNGLYSIRSNLNRSYYLDVDGGQDTNERNVQIYADSSRRFRIRWEFNTAYTSISPTFSNTKVLDVYGGEDTSRLNTNVQIYPYSRGGNQTWEFEKAHTEQFSPTSITPLVKYNNEWYFNYDAPVNAMINRNVSIAKSNSLKSNTQFGVELTIGSVLYGPLGYHLVISTYIPYQAYTFYWFFTKVNHHADWDIKWPDIWRGEVGENIPYLKNEKFYYHGMLMTPADLGNYMYGYMGRALGLGSNIIYWGGGVAHVRNSTYKEESDLLKGYALAMLDSQTVSYPYGDLPEDTAMIANGISVFDSDYPGYKTVISNPPNGALFDEIYKLFL